MTREEFFAKLDARLSILNEKERKDIIDEYQSHIDFKIQDGKTEAQAIADFGDIDDLAAEILEAYHIDNNAAKSKSLEYYIKACVNFINQVTERILSLSLSDIARIIVEFIVVLFAIWLVSIPFDIVSSSIRNTIWTLQLGGLSELLAGIVNLFFELISLGISFLIIYSFIKTRIMTKTPVMPKYAEKSSTADCNVKYTDNPQQSSFNPEYANFDVNTGKPLKNRKTLGDVGKSSGDFLVKMIVAILKVFLFICIWLPGVFCSIGFLIATALLIVLLVSTGIGLWGLNLIVAGCAVISLGVTVWLTDVIFGGKKKNEEVQ
ncbi:MAG: DUF1700 domain-containing protein [Ruminococcaceae bacterium]|nr:DUF1700 domain-containing protein [Oscillospiraceae bacterium]